MTKQGVVVPPNSAPLFQYPLPRAVSGVSVRRKYLQMGASTDRVVGGGWVGSLRASSPTHARAGIDEDRYARVCPYRIIIAYCTVE
jgi:trehalose 6-phosphate phosphatase